MLSILIPVYNYDIHPLVKELYLQGVQQEIDFEILIADDASTNPALKAKSQYYNKLEHCKVFVFSNNKGRTYTRNFLAEKAASDKILFLDADILPKKDDFLIKFLQHQSEADLIFGGIDYTTKPPSWDKRLRWKYGRNREARSLKERQENPYISIISGALFVKKDLFIKVNKELQNAYGLDSVFVENLKNTRAKILHIDNPVVHLGLESNIDFIHKSEKGLQSLVELEKENKVGIDYRAVQRAYKKLNSLGMCGAFCRFYKMYHTIIKRNLLSKNPSLFYFDLYKLNYYIRLKRA
ncbi:MAG TPA: glycosyltransferase family 2 protein [Flavobacteriaceae bacterium]|nr:glycosyltransferase family 2 protein [Flavobacteriaceae bacterium]